MTNPVQSTPYLRNQRTFPEESDQLSTELSKAYIDIATATNNRTIGIFPTGNPAVNGEAWYLSGGNNKQQALRQVFPFTGAGSIAHNIKSSSISKFSRGFGAYTDGTNWYGVVFASSVPIAGQVSFYVTSTNVVVLVDAGAPAVTSGLIVVEWISVV